MVDEVQGSRKSTEAKVERTILIHGAELGGGELRGKEPGAQHGSHQDDGARELDLSGYTGPVQ